VGERKRRKGKWGTEGKRGFGALRGGGWF